MQTPEHIEQDERILAGLLYSLPDGRNCDYLRGAHHMLIWVMRPETEACWDVSTACTCAPPDSLRMKR